MSKVVGRSGGSSQAEKKRPARPPITEKKANGDGTVYYDKHKRVWTAAITIGKKPNGKPKVMKSSASTKSEALELRRKLQSDKQNDQIMEPSKLTLRELSIKWLNQRLLIRSSTRERSAYHLHHILDIVGDRKVQSIKTEDIISVLNQLNNKKMSHGDSMARITLKHVRTHLWMMFDYAVNTDVIRKNPVTSATKIKDVNDVGGRPLTATQVTRLCKVGEAFYQAGLLRLWPAMYVALRTGVRRGELFSLTWQNIDFAQKTLGVRSALTLVDGKYVPGEPKTKNAKRDLPMYRTLPEFLKQLQIDQQRQFKVLGLRWAPQTPVFATEQGNYTSPDNLYRSLKLLINWADPSNLEPVQGEPYIWRGIKTTQRSDLMAVVAAGEALPVISPHDLRHTYATLMLMNEVRLEVVSKLLGHADVAITLKVYRKIFPVEMDATRQVDICKDALRGAEEQ
jgi:integrase